LAAGIWARATLESNGLDVSHPQLRVVDTVDRVVAGAYDDVEAVHCRVQLHEEADAVEDGSTRLPFDPRQRQVDANPDGVGGGQHHSTAAAAGGDRHQAESTRQRGGPFQERHRQIVAARAAPVWIRSRNPAELILVIPLHPES
jgi:hypothetical protein